MHLPCWRPRLSAEFARAASGVNAARVPASRRITRKQRFGKHNFRRRRRRQQYPPTRATPSPSAEASATTSRHRTTRKPFPMVTLAVVYVWISSANAQTARQSGTTRTAARKPISSKDIIGLADAPSDDLRPSGEDTRRTTLIIDEAHRGRCWEGDRCNASTHSGFASSRGCHNSFPSARS